jgi:hypothetical protein
MMPRILVTTVATDQRMHGNGLPRALWPGRRYGSPQQVVGHDLRDRAPNGLLAVRPRGVA